MAEEMEVSKLTATPKFKREYYDAYQDKFQDIPFEQFEGLVENRILQDPKFLKQMGDDLYNFYRHKMSRAEFDAEFLGSIDKSDPTLLKLRSRAADSQDRRRPHPTNIGEKQSIDSGMDDHQTGQQLHRCRFPCGSYA